MRAFLVAGFLLLAGCIVQETSSPRVISASALGPGLEMTANVTSNAGSHLLHAQVRNVGPHTYNISSICMPVFSHHIDNDRGRVWPADQAVCLAYGVQPFAPGAKEGMSATWNQTDQDDEPVQDGDYLWVVTFHYQEDEASGWKTLEVEVPFEVR